MIHQVISDMVPVMVRSIVQEEVRSELQSFYERISTLIKRSSTHPTPALGPPPPPPPPPPLSPPHAVFGPSSPPPHFPPPQAEKEVDDTAHAAADTPPALAGTDMVYFF